MVPRLPMLIAVLLIAALPCKGEEVETLRPFSVLLSGGGFYGGINPSSSSRAIRDCGSVVVVRKYLRYETRDSASISASQIEEIAAFILENGFFELDTLYDCREDDTACAKVKLGGYPRVVPLTLTVAMGDRAHSVTATVFEFPGLAVYDSTLTMPEGETSKYLIPLALRLTELNADYPSAFANIVGRVFAVTQEALEEAIRSK